MGELLECKHCGSRLKWQRCIIHLKHCHNISMTDIYQHYTKLDIPKEDNQSDNKGKACSEKTKSISVHSKRSNKKNNTKKQSIQTKEYAIKCSICGAIIKKHYRTAHYSTVHNIGVPDVFKHKSQGRRNFKSNNRTRINNCKKRCILCGEIMTEGVELKHLKEFHSNIDLKEMGVPNALIKLFISADKPYSGWAQKVGIDKIMANDNYNRADYKPLWMQILYHRNGGK